MGSFVVLCVAGPLNYFPCLFYPFAGDVFGFYALSSAVAIAFIYIVTFVYYPKYKIFLFIVFLLSLLILKPYLYFLLGYLLLPSEDSAENINNSATAINIFMMYLYTIMVVLYGVLFDVIKYFSLKRVYKKDNDILEEKLQKDKYSVIKKLKPYTMLILAFIFIFTLILNKSYTKEKRLSVNDRIENYFIDNKAEFALLRDEINIINNNFNNWNQDSIKLKAKTNPYIDSLSRKLKIVDIDYSYNEDKENITIRLKLDLNNSIPLFEFWYNDKDNRQFSWSDGTSSSRIREIEHWCIYRYERDKE